VVPIGIQGGFQILPKGRALPQPGPLKVRFGPPVEVPRDADNLVVVSMLEKAVADLIDPEDSKAPWMAPQTEELPI
jgi:1-acyl-sn-glycerol-3-phosphate acyltransferase